MSTHSSGVERPTVVGYRFRMVAGSNPAEWIIFYVLGSILLRGCGSAFFSVTFFQLKYLYLKDIII